MRAADGVGLVGAGGAFVQIKAANAALRRADVGWSLAARPGLSRPLRRRLTEALGLQGARRLPGTVINAVVRQRLLDATAGAVGMVSSASSGIFSDIAVWMTSEKEEAF